MIPIIDNAVSYRYADKTNYLSGITHNSSVLGTSKLDFTYGNLANGQMPDQIYSVKWNDVSKKNYTYDGLGRVTSQTVYPSVGRSLYSTYTYKDTTANTTTTIVSGVQSSLGDYSYQYDANGNITRIDYNNLRVATSALTQYQVNYEYDELNQLIRCYGDNISYGGTYTYDDNGNITSKNNNTYGYTNSVWGDLLTSYNGNTITYDTIGNPLTYKNGENFMWQNGRRLNMILDGDDITAVYYYDVSGSRISKSTEAGDTFFTYAGDILAAQKTGNNILVWIYDNNGAYIGFSYNGVEYYYVYNLQGDVEALADSNGTIIARYTYDPWGKIVAITDAALNDISSDATHIANINPIRYRGYYYDTETNFYYLNSRYYDPEICRFINADTTDVLTATPTELTDKNLFAYCDNNPVLRADDGGEFWHLVVGAVVGAVVSGVAKVASNIIEGKPITDGLGTSVLAGAASGLLASTGVGVLGQMAGNAAISMANNAVDQVYKNKGFNNFNVDDMLIDGVAGAVSGKLGGAGIGNPKLSAPAKLMNKNIVRSVKNGTKNGIKAAVKNYGRSRAVKAFYTETKDGIVRGIGQEIGISLATQYCRRLFLMERC